MYNIFFNTEFLHLFRGYAFVPSIPMRAFRLSEKKTT